MNGVFALLINGQVVSPSFRHFTTEDGLPSSEVYSVLQDRKGNMWFGTDRGVSKFDGYKFRTFTYKDGLTDNTVFKMYEDNRGKLWILTYSGRIFYFEDNKIFPYKYNDILFEAVQSKVPLGFIIDSLDNIFVSLRDLGELKINSGGKLEKRFIKDKIPEINYLVDEFSPDELLVSIMLQGSKNKIFKILHSKDKIIESISLVSVPAERIEALRLTKDKLLFTLGKFLYEKTEDSVKFLMSFPGNVFTLMKDNQQNVWAGSENGIYFIDKNNLKTFSNHYLEQNSVTCILQDHEGGYWFTTLNNGVYYMPGYGIKGIPFNQGLLQKPTCLTTDYLTSIYAGCWNGAMVQIGNGQTRLIYYPGSGLYFPVTNLSSFSMDEKIYLSRSKPGYVYKGRFYFYKSARDLGIKTNFIKRSDGNLFAAGTSFIFKNKNDSIVQYAVINQRINCLAETANNQLLLGCNRGVFVYDEITKQAILFRKELNDIRVDDIKWSENKLLFATKGKGLLVLMKDSIIKIDESNGLCSNLVNKLLVTGNEVWCTTNKGISHIYFNGPDKFSYTIININSRDGLFSDEINDITRLNDTIYVATNYGISFFNARTDFVNHTNPPVYITSLQVNNRDTSFTGLMEFKHDNNNFQIGFNGISFRSREKIWYRYQLTRGTDTISSFTNNREVEFLSLQPGYYTFHVSAMNNSGIWSLSPAIFSFTINPAWWQTWWLKLIVVFFFAAGIYVFYKNKVKNLKHDFEMERRQGSLQLTAMRAQMNPHFVFNVMSSIRNYMQNHDMKSAEKYLTSFSRLVRYVLDNSEVQEVTLEEELNALRNYAELEMQRFENGFEFNIVVEKGINLSETFLLSMLLQPFVENAIKHGISRMKSGGKILIDIRKTKGSILIAVEDNGVGIEEASRWNEAHRETHVSHGTSINLERIVAYNKVYNKNIKTRFINLTDNDGKSVGTRVEVEI